MNCEQVKEQLSAYLDGALAMEERAEVRSHLQMCARCTAVLSDFHHFDLLIAYLPRVTPDDSFYQKLFLSPEYRELTGTFGVATPHYGSTLRYIPRRQTSHILNHPHLVVLPGGKSHCSPVLPQEKKSLSIPTSSRSSTMLKHAFFPVLAIILFLFSFVFTRLFGRRFRSNRRHLPSR